MISGCVLLAACSGGGSGGPGIDAAAGDGGTIPDGGGPGIDGGGGGDDGGGADERLYPLAVGRSWTYEVGAVGAGAVCAPGTYSEEVLGTTSVGGREAFEVAGWCSAVGTNYLASDGDKVEVYYNGGWIVVLDTPVEEGHTWTSTGPVVYTWKQEGAVTVPAGTFDDCWRREQQVSYTAYTIYCRGVGAVIDYSQDLAGNGWDARLSASSP